MADISAFTDLLRRAADANVRFYQGLLDLSVEYLRNVSDVVQGFEAGAPRNDASSQTGVLILEAQQDEEAQGVFVVTNHLDRRIRSRMVPTAFLDPEGTSIEPGSVRFEPAALDLAPGAEQLVHAYVRVDERLSPGVGYRGAFSMQGLEGFTVPVVLRRRYAVGDVPGEAEVARSAVRAKKAAARKSPTRAKAANTRTKAPTKRRRGAASKTRKRD